MKKTARIIILIILLTIILTACSSPIQSETGSENVTETIEHLNTETIEPTITETICQPTIVELIEPTFTKTAEPLKTPTPLADLEPGELPVILSYIEEVDGERKIISTALNFQADYSAISVERGTNLRRRVVVDRDLNLYILYGARIFYLSKLSVDGKIETIELPYQRSMYSAWAGNQLFVMGSTDSMSIINTNMEITTIFPALNVFEDGVYYDGKIRTTMDPSPTVIWTAWSPIVDETGDYVLVRTLSLDTLTTSEYQLKIPDTNWDWYESGLYELGERTDTYVYTVDLPSEIVFLCYLYLKESDLSGISIASKLEIYASKTGETVASLDFPCLNRNFTLHGNSIISMTNPLSGGRVLVAGLNDLQPSFDVTEFFDMKNYYDNRVYSNGVYWQIISPNEITVIYSNLQHNASYPIPSNLPEDLISGTTLVPAFLIDE